MKLRLWAALVPWVSLAIAGCLQELNTGAASGSPTSPTSAAASGPIDTDASSWVVCGAPSCDNANGTIPFLQQSPPIYLPTGQTTNDPCGQVEAASLAIRQTYCGNCHGPNTGAGQGSFNYVMDDSALVKNRSSNATFPNLVVPGNPAQSYLYVRMAGNTMPPASIPGAPPNPVPSSAELSVLYGWILQCFPGADGGYVNGGGYYGPPMDGGGAPVDGGAG